MVNENKIDSLYELIKQKSQEKTRPLKIIVDWDEVLKSREATVYHIVANRPCLFADFFRKFWENASVEYQGHTCKVLNTNLEEIERLREESPEKFQKKARELAKTDINLYEESPWLSIAEDLLKVLKEGLVDYFVITGNYKKDRCDKITGIDETLGGDPRKRRKFSKSFAKFPNTKLEINTPFYTEQGEVQLSRPEWIKNNYPDFDLFIDDNPNNISGTRNIFSSDSSKIYVLPDYGTNKNVQGENVFRVMVQPTLLKDENFSSPLVLDWRDIHQSFAQELIQKWQDLGFTYEQTQEWASVLGNSFSPEEHGFINWLANIKNYIPETALNQANVEELRAEFEQSQQIAQIVQQTTNN